MKTVIRHLIKKEQQPSKYIVSSQTKQTITQCIQYKKCVEINKVVNSQELPQNLVGMFNNVRMAFNRQAFGGKTRNWQRTIKKTAKILAKYLEELLNCEITKDKWLRKASKHRNNYSLPKNQELEK